MQIDELDAFDPRPAVLDRLWPQSWGEPHEAVSGAFRTTLFPALVTGDDC